VSLSIQTGDFIAIMGPSGSRKSTLANVIGGLDRPTRGTVVVDGENLAEMKDSSLSRFRNEKIGFVFQAFNLKSDSTALENVMLPLVFGRMRAADRKVRAAECLERVGLGERQTRLPNQLSGGERQRVAIARALVNKPAVIIADEPTGNLDSARGDEIVELLRKLNDEGTTLMVITHDQDVGRHARRIIEVHDGRLREAVPS